MLAFALNVIPHHEINQRNDAKQWIIHVNLLLSRHSTIGAADLIRSKGHDAHQSIGKAHWRYSCMSHNNDVDESITEVCNRTELAFYVNHAAMKHLKFESFTQMVPQ